MKFGSSFENPGKKPEADRMVPEKELPENFKNREIGELSSPEIKKREKENPRVEKAREALTAITEAMISLRSTSSQENLEKWEKILKT